MLIWHRNRQKVKASRSLLPSPTNCPEYDGELSQESLQLLQHTWPSADKHNVSKRAATSQNAAKAIEGCVHVSTEGLTQESACCIIMRSGAGSPVSLTKSRTGPQICHPRTGDWRKETPWAFLVNQSIQITYMRGLGFFCFFFF